MFPLDIIAFTVIYSINDCAIVFVCTVDDSVCVCVCEYGFDV